jgi:hypothetical protein
MDMKVPQLSEKAMLVKLTIRRANLSRRDTAAELLIQQTMDDASLVVNSKLFRDKNNPINQIMAAASEVYTYHKKHTLPWQDKGPRVVPNAMYFEYTQAMRGLINNVDAMLNNHMPNYGTYVDRDIAYRSKSVSGGRATRDDYPTNTQFRERMGFDMRFTPMPDARHFLFDLTDEDQQKFDEAMVQTANAASNDVVLRMLEPLTHLVSKLNTPIGAQNAIFRDTALTNVVEGVELAKKLAIDPPPELRALMDSLAATVTKCVTGKDLLREDAPTRESAAKKLAALQSQMSAFMGAA